LKLLVVLDVDSTLIQQEVIDLLAARANQSSRVEEITERAMAGELDFESSLRERVGLLRGLSESVLEEVLGELTPTPGVQQLIAAVHREGGKVGAVSGGFSQILDPLANGLKLDFNRANTLEVIDGKLTGAVSGPVIDAQAKADALLQWSLESGIDNSNTVAIGDGANDIKMLQAAGVAIAFCPKEVLRGYADIVIETPDLTPLIAKLGLSAG
jgi:phosphoserine phosphatase